MLLLFLLYSPVLYLSTCIWFRVLSLLAPAVPHSSAPVIAQVGRCMSRTHARESVKTRNYAEPCTFKLLSSPSSPSFFCLCVCASSDLLSSPSSPSFCVCASSDDTVDIFCRCCLPSCIAKRFHCLPAPPSPTLPVPYPFSPPHHNLLTLLLKLILPLEMMTVLFGYWPLLFLHLVHDLFLLCLIDQHSRFARVSI